MPTTFRIHPAIGVARLGDSPTDYYIGPEAPGVPPTFRRSDPSDTKPNASPNESGLRRDSQNRIKRQGARFRVYEYTTDDAGQTTRIREITSADAQIEWQVQLVNRKAAVAEFNSQNRRNPETPASKLIIDAGVKKISGVNKKMKRLAGKFMGRAVALGDLLTDGAGRLIVLGGFGKSEAVPAGKPLADYSNNDGWHDDVADGPIHAWVKLNGSNEKIAADSAYVLVAPPDYATEITNVITLYDIVYHMQALLDSSLAVNADTPLSFTRDIYPLLKRPSMMPWVSDISARGHAPGKGGHFLARLAPLSSNKPEDQPARMTIFKRLRNPYTGKGGNMPKLPASVENEIALTVTFTPVQYGKMEKWANGQFDSDWTGHEPAPIPFAQLPTNEQPHALDRAALEYCVGSGRFPGIEAGNIMLERDTYDPARPFRLNAAKEPGFMTARMAVPWQADYRDCEYEEDIGLDWWPAQRPNDVYRMISGELKRVSWVPKTKVWTAGKTRRGMMVKHWMKLGFIKRKVMNGEEKFVEEERLLKE